MTLLLLLCRCDEAVFGKGDSTNPGPSIHARNTYGDGDLQCLGVTTHWIISFWTVYHYFNFNIFCVLVTLISPEEMFLKQAGLIINFPGKEITEPLKPLFSRGDLGIIMLQIVLFIIRPGKQSKLKKRILPALCFCTSNSIWKLLK